MPRLTLFEIEDLPSCPVWLRNAMTGYLQKIITVTRPYAVAGEPLAALLRESGERRIVNLAPGAGGPFTVCRSSPEHSAAARLFCDRATKLRGCRLEARTTERKAGGVQGPGRRKGVRRVKSAKAPTPTPLPEMEPRAGRR